MKFIRYLAAFIAVVIIQTTLCRLISIKGIAPDLLLCFLLFLATKEGALIGVFTGFSMGLILDVYSPQTLGIGSLVGSVIGYLAGFLDERKITLDDKYKLPVVFLAALLKGVLTAALVFNAHAAFHHLFLSQILPTAFYTTLVGGVLLLIIGRRK
ncbi:MAG: rod shape-determining protein MreD [Elusimicrobia bacterium RIFOXYB2_FULL_49_7]|nr:MAG: rod shape-determining protein MreD [Elusimicrobia bacterium RIFOXYB2_FULL_49_7]